ncbi:malolactic enzyme [Acetilactobacillus jinshanensis]|uniref:Malolactic enzyme n=1 Tax=Acetilactobacillus jinshanensis TaxID=1720083 RepID=A0A4P6ZKA0_9LACO|nr:malolactic enzyme [Acetilactobacillus jinshanensis]QBP18185.1 NAD-dependent malic enzyme [Acetilactobacillus jinshanensis]URL61052.1 NAD-dependent malic enzyme [uncultured bacterium]
MINMNRILNNPFKNKGTAFTLKERQQLGLDGLLPPKVQTLQQQVDQAYQQYQSKPTNLAKRQFLMTIFNTNRILFYKLFSQHVVEFMPIVYDPTIAEDIEKYSDIFTQPQGAAYISIDNQNSTNAIKRALVYASDGRKIRLIVVTDAQEILGIGDWGVNGVDICVGKLMVYTAAAGIDPREVLPVVLDVGTDNQKLLKSPNYLGNRHARVTGDKYYDFVDKFVKTAESTFPDMYLHFEDFGRDNAANILNKYRSQYTVFNDDIQGTGIIILASILGALNISHEKLTDQRYLCFGAGTAGTGIANHVYREFIQQGLSPKEAKKHFYLVDKQGLLFKDDPTLTPQQKVFARDKSEFDHPDRLTDLLSVVKAIHPTILVGTSTAPGTFTKQVVQEMAAHTKRPIICPISNPTKLAEAKPKDLLNWTDGKALIATGVPYPDIKANNGVTYQIGQANNALVYPGVGLGVLAVHATRLSDEMISAAAHSLGGIVDTTKPGAAVLPPVSKLNQFSNNVAIAVAKTAVKQGLTKSKISVDDVPKLVKQTRWSPHY